ncbi:hypothetical protein EG329_012696 [Mollisiaceae sp. DMI_Dod_QoI]|nr:hypothetical protein EG329_012696 [Helotiales sp. DMI_Dod_QoI]
MSSNLRQRSVVSSFICTAPNSPSGFTFALFKRSQDVSTYRGKWAVCSGSIDKTDLSPAAAAKREILEETGLSDSDISLLRRGKPFSLTDEALQTRWTIHPFAWQLKEGAKEIKFDWEHTEYRFVKPEALKNYEHVPQLEVGLERVVVSPKTEKALAILRDDHESGAQVLSLKALGLLLQAARSEELTGIESTEEYWKQLRWIAWHLAKNGRPSMAAAIESVVFKALDDIEQHFTTTGSISAVPLTQFISVIDSVIASNLQTGHANLEPIAINFTDLIISRTKILENETTVSSIKIVTLSASGTVKAGLGRTIAQLINLGIKVKLTVLESRPNFEGVSFVHGLLKNLDSHHVLPKIEVEIVADASAATAVKDAHFVVFGGDKVIPNGDVSNKMGTFTLAAMAKTVNPACKIIALFETNKITSSSFDSEYLTIEENDPKEMTNAWPASFKENLEDLKAFEAEVKVKNEYFEWVPAKFIDQHITEKGVWSVDDIAKFAAEIEEREKRLFGDLS